MLEPGFAEFGGQVVLFCHITSRIPARSYDDLLLEKGGRGFPTLMFLDASGEVLGVHNGPRTVDGFAKTLASVQKKAREFAALRAKADAGDRGARARLLILELQNGALSFGEGSKAAQELGEFSGATRKDLAEALAVAEYREVLEQVKGMTDAAVVAGGKFHAMARANRIPDGERAGKFWPYILEHAAAEGDLATFDKALARYQDQLAKTLGRGSPAYRQLSERAESLREDARRNKGRKKD